MRIDVVTIFPDYLEPLRQSLPGKAIDAGIIVLAVHDLRRWTHDVHRSVDDSPYGGGPGMVMTAPVWGEALDEICSDETLLIVPTPAGRLFGQADAQRWSTEKHLVFACGRYEGIDQRVVDDAARRMRVEEISIGDYVLPGGESATLVMIEAVVRLLPDVLGNPASHQDDSHSNGLLEGPAYTRPPSWRGLNVPEVLLSGDHARIAAWRREQAERRTADRRPDLLPATGLVGALADLDVRPAVPADAGELYTLQRACWLQEMEANPGVDIPALRETLDDVRRGVGEWTVRVAREPSSGRLVGAVRGRLDGHGEWDIGRIMVAPDLQGRGLGRALLELVEDLAPADVTTYVLFTGAGSVDNQRMYKKAGFRLRPDRKAPPGAVVMTKQARRRISR